MDDASIRLAAMHHCAQLLREHSGAVPWPAIQAGFILEGARIFLGSTPRGIHRPIQMARGVLSIKTTKPKLGGVSRYNDELRNDGYFMYAFQGRDPSNHDNTALLQAHEDGTPCIYFKAITPGLYQILFPCFIATWNAESLACSISVGSAAEIARAAGPRVSEIERRYTTVEAKVRLHQPPCGQLALFLFRELLTHHSRSSGFAIPFDVGDFHPLFHADFYRRTLTCSAKSKPRPRLAGSWTITHSFTLISQVRSLSVVVSQDSAAPLSAPNRTAKWHTHFVRRWLTPKKRILHRLIRSLHMVVFACPVFRVFFTESYRRALAQQPSISLHRTI